MDAFPLQDEEMEIRRMHELVEQTTQVLQQAGWLRLSRLRLSLMILILGSRPSKSSTSPIGRFKAESGAWLSSIARHSKQAQEDMQCRSQLPLTVFQYSVYRHIGSCFFVLCVSALVNSGFHLTSLRRATSSSR